MPISSVECKTHKVDIYRENENTANITLDESEKAGGNRDFVLSYRLQGDKIKTGLLLSKCGKENFFLLMLQPPKEVKKEDLPPRDYIFIMDVSGSMHGFPLDVSSEVVTNILSNLNPQDKFNILFFSGSSSFLFEKSMEATKDNISKANNFIGSIRGGGGTELLPAVEKALSIPKEPGYSRTIAIMTDGYVAVEEETFDLIRNNLGGANFYAFGIGSSVNRYLIEGIARCGMGEPFIVLNHGDAEEKAEKFLKYISSPVMTDIKINFDGFETYDVEPKTIPDVTAERPILVFGKWRDQPAGNINVSGIAGKQELMVDIPLNVFAEFDTSSALKYLWARHRISLLSDYGSSFNGSKKEDEITDLGLKYNLLTKYTSFVAVDYNRKNNASGSETISQPLPMPQGVSDLAVGNTYTGGYGSAEANPLAVGRKSTAVYTGPSFGYNRSNFNSVPELSDISIPEFKDFSAAGNGFTAGLNFIYPFRAVNSIHAIKAQLLYDSRKCSYKALLGQKLNPVTGDPVQVEAERSLKISYFTIDMIYSYMFFKTLHIELGPSFSFLLNSNMITNFSLPGDKTFRTEDNPILALNGKSQEIKDLSSMLMSVKFQLSYDIMMSSRWFITPYSGYDFGLTNIRKDTQWKINNFQAGVNITFAM